MRRIITATVQNKSGVLNRVTGLLLRRNLNIESMSVSPTDVKGISKMTFEIKMEDTQKLEQLAKQINKQIDVLKVSYTTENYIY
jgi:acetolactate synthase I/III small subunit